MYLSEMLEHAIKKENEVYHLNDIELHSDKYEVDVYVGWHSGFNVGHYPIIQVDDNDGNMILWKEGPERLDICYEWMKEVLKDYLSEDDWYFLR